MLWDGSAICSYGVYKNIQIQLCCRGRSIDQLLRRGGEVLLIGVAVKREQEALTRRRVGGAQGRPYAHRALGTLC